MKLGCNCWASHAGTEMWKKWNLRPIHHGDPEMCKPMDAVIAEFVM